MIIGSQHATGSDLATLGETLHLFEPVCSSLKWGCNSMPVSPPTEVTSIMANGLQ